MFWLSSWIFIRCASDLRRVKNSSEHASALRLCLAPQGWTLPCVALIQLSCCGFVDLSIHCNAFCPSLLLGSFHSVKTPCIDVPTLEKWLHSNASGSLIMCDLWPFVAPSSDTSSARTLSTHHKAVYQRPETTTPSGLSRFPPHYPELVSDYCRWNWIPTWCLYLVSILLLTSTLQISS